MKKKILEENGKKIMEINVKEMEAKRVKNWRLIINLCKFITNIMCRLFV
jgi:hypothetical protein